MDNKQELVLALVQFATQQLIGLSQYKHVNQQLARPILPAPVGGTGELVPMVLRDELA